MFFFCCCFFVYLATYSETENVVIKSMLFQLNVGHKDANVSQLQMLCMRCILVPGSYVVL